MTAAPLTGPECRRLFAAGTRLVFLDWRGADIPDDVGEVRVRDYRGKGFAWGEVGGQHRRGNIGWPDDAEIHRAGDHVTVTTPVRDSRRPRGLSLSFRVTGAPETLPATLRIYARPGPADGHPYRSDYVEAVWLPRLGPAAWAALLQIGDLVDAAGSDWQPLDLVWLAETIGVSPKLGHQSPVWKVVARLGMFRLLRRQGDDSAVVSRLCPLLPVAEIERLPERLQAYAHRFTAAPRATV